MSGFTVLESVYIGLCLEGLFYGFYTALFVLYLKCEACKQDSDNYLKRTSIIFYPLCIIYVLSLALVVTDIAGYILLMDNVDERGVYLSSAISSVFSGCCDFIAQSILIYRCWIVWNRNIRVVIIPSILAITFLGLWIPGSILLYDPIPGWVYPATLTSLSMSLAVNALVTSLIVLRIVQVYRRVVKSTGGSTSRSKLRPVIFILIESGMALLCMQLIQLVLNVLGTETAKIVDQPIAYILQMLNGITPTIIQVRVAMGLSFHDEKSMIEATSSMRFGSDYSTSIPETVCISIVYQESRDDDSGIRVNDDKDKDTLKI